MWDLIVSVPDHCLSFYFVNCNTLFRQIYVPHYFRLIRRFASQIPFFLCVCFVLESSKSICNKFSHIFLFHYLSALAENVKSLCQNMILPKSLV